jgi:hypothetical protein
MHSDTYNEMMTARAEGEPEPEPTIVVAAETLETFPAPADDITHYVGDDCPGGHYDELPAVEAYAAGGCDEVARDEAEDKVLFGDALLCAPPAPTLEGVSDGTTFYVRNGVRIAFPGEHTADEVEEAFRGAGF